MMRKETHLDKGKKENIFEVVVMSVQHQNAHAMHVEYDLNLLS